MSKPKLVLSAGQDWRKPDAQFECSACAHVFKLVPAYGGWSIRGAISYRQTRFDKHVERYHAQVQL